MTRPAALLLALASLPATAATYYVAPPPGGNDANPGTLAQPWATLQQAAGEVQPGDTVYVREGSYAGGHFTTSGTALDPIVLAAFPGETPVVDADNPVTPDGINLEGASHMVVEGFTVTGITRAGLRAVLCEHVTFRGNRAIDNGRWGILTGFCDDLLIEGNETSRSAIEHGIYVSNSSDRPVIRDNLILDNNANGIHLNGDASLGGDGLIEEALIEGNIIAGNGQGGGSGINGDGLVNSLIRNNLVHSTHASGISLYRIDGGAPASGNRVYNNTVLVASDGRWALNIRDGSTGTQVSNNIFWSEHGFRGAMTVCDTCLSGMQSDHNLVEDRFTLDDGDSVLTLAQWRAATGLDANSAVATPGQALADPAGGDFLPRDGGPAVDAGANLGADVPTDLAGNPRPQGAGYDIGAYELVGIFADGFEDPVVP